MLKWIFLVFLLLMASSCIRDANPDEIIDQQRMLYIFSNISNDDDFIKVSIYLTKEFYNQKKDTSRPRYIEDVVNSLPIVSTAKVRLDDGSKYLDLTYDPDGQNYTASTARFPINEGKTYTLTVIYQKITAKASCKLPQNRVVFNPVLKDTFQILGNGNMSYKYTLKGKMDLKGHSSTEIDYRASADIIYFKKDTILANNVSFYNNSSSPINFTDTVQVGLFGSYKILNFQIASSVYVYSKEIQNYISTGDSRYRYRPYDPLGEPVSRYTNFTNAFGVFGATNIKTTEIEIIIP